MGSGTMLEDDVNEIIIDCAKELGSDDIVYVHRI
jgi:hypothetical protein